MNIIKGFLAVSLFTVVPVRLYALSVSLQGTFSAGLTGYGRSIGEVGQDIITELSEIVPRRPDGEAEVIARKPFQTKSNRKGDRNYGTH